MLKSFKYREFFLHVCLFLPPRLNIATQENLGNYSCVFGGDVKFDFVLAGNDHV